MVRDERNVTGIKMLDAELVFRGSAVALESSGMPTVPNNLRSQTPDRSSTPGDTRRVRVSNWYTKTHRWKHTRETICITFVFVTQGFFSCLCTQPDGAESVASLRSVDSPSEKKAAGHHRKDSDTPTISVSRVSVSSGAGTHTSVVSQLHRSHRFRQSRSQDVLEAATSY